MLWGVFIIIFGLPFCVYCKAFELSLLLGFECHIFGSISQHGASFLCSSCAHMDNALYGYEQLLELQIKRLRDVEFWWWDFNGVLFFVVVVVAWLKKETQSSSIVLGGT
jgi:hypothetical protein